MSISVSYADLFSGSYAARIQDALGNSGATAVVTTNNGGYEVSINGTPTGSGLKTEAGEPQSSGSPRTASDTITISPAAQAKLEQQTVAVQLLSADKATSSYVTGKTAATSPQSASGSGQTPSSPTVATDVNDVKQLAQEDPTQVVKGIVSAAVSDVAAISTTQGFNQTAAENPQFFSQLTSGLSSDDAASVQNAFSNGTLTVQPLAGSGLTLSGSSEAFTPDQAASFRPTAGSNYLELSFGVGAIVLSWPTAT